MKKLIFTVMLFNIISIIMLTSCKKEEVVTPDNNSSQEPAIKGDTNVIGLLSYDGFVSTSPNYNTLYGNSRNDFLLHINESAAGDVISKIDLIVKNGNDWLVLDLTSTYTNSFESIEDQEYTCHLVADVGNVNNADDVEAFIYAYNKNDEELAKIEFTLKTRNNKPESIQVLKFPSFTKIYSYKTISMEEAVYIGGDDEEGQVGDIRISVTRTYSPNTDLNLKDISLYYVNKNNEEVFIDDLPSLYDFNETSHSSYLLFHTFLIEAAHFIDHDYDETTPRVAIYRQRFTENNMPDIHILNTYTEFRIIETTN